MKNKKILINMIFNIIIIYLLGLGFSGKIIKFMFFMSIALNIKLIKQLGLTDIYLPYLLMNSVSIIFCVLSLNGTSLAAVISNTSKYLYYLSVFYLYFRISRSYEENYLIYIQKILLAISCISIILLVIYHNPIPININGYQYYTLFKPNFFARNALTGPFIQPNEFGDLQIFLIIIALYNLNETKRLSVASIIVGFLSIFLSISRTALILAILVVISYFFINTNFKKKVNLSLIVCFVAIVVGVLNIYNPDLMRNLMGTKFNQDNLFSGRSQLWEASIQLINEHTLVGVDNDIIRQSYDSILDPSLKGLGAHNMYLHLMVTSGIIGITCIFMTILLILLKVKFKQICKRDLFLITSLFISVFIRGFTESGLVFVFGVRIFLVWLLFGIFIGKNYRHLNRVKI